MLDGRHATDTLESTKKQFYENVIMLLKEIEIIEKDHKFDN